MTDNDLEAIRQSGYISEAFNSLGIAESDPKLEPNGDIAVDCDGIYRGDSVIVADRISQKMGRKGWNVDVWFDEKSKTIRINYKEKEE